MPLYLKNPRCSLKQHKREKIIWFGQLFHTIRAYVELTRETPKPALTLAQGNYTYGVFNRKLTYCNVTPLLWHLSPARVNAYTEYIRNLYCYGYSRRYLDVVITSSHVLPWLSRDRSFHSHVLYCPGAHHLPSPPYSLNIDAEYRLRKLVV